MTRTFMLFLILGYAYFCPILMAQEGGEVSLRPDLSRDWRRAVRGFRREHNFSTSYGYAISRWKGHLTDDPNVFSFRNQTHQIRLAYAFHLPLVGGFGYYLGTQVSSIFTASAPGKDDEIAYGLPGLNAGLILNLSDRARVASGIELGWQRIERLRLPEQFQRKRIAVTGETRVWSGQIDYFYELSWALQLTYESTELNYAPAESLAIRKLSRSWSLGILKHLI